MLSGKRAQVCRGKDPTYRIITLRTPKLPGGGCGSFSLEKFWRFGLAITGRFRLRETPIRKVRTREAQLSEAEENLRRMKDDVATGIDKTYNKLEKAKSMVVWRYQVVELRRESERLAQNQLAQGEVLISVRSEATALLQTQADYLQARLGLSARMCRNFSSRLESTPGL